MICIDLSYANKLGRWMGAVLCRLGFITNGALEIVVES